MAELALERSYLSTPLSAPAIALPHAVPHVASLQTCQQQQDPYEQVRKQAGEAAWTLPRGLSLHCWFSPAPSPWRSLKVPVIFLAVHISGDSLQVVSPCPLPPQL